MKYDVMIFDCDGVVMDATPIKTNAFVDTVADYPQNEVAEFTKYHLANGGISRYVKYQYFVDNIASNPKHSVEELVEKFGEICQQKLIDCPLIDGLEDILIKAKANNIPCYVNSGADEAELEIIFTKKDIAKYFKMICGSPNDKVQNMGRILNDLAIDKFNNAVFYGDGKWDMEVAQQFNVDAIFIYGVTEYTDWENDDNIMESYKNFTSLIT